MPAVKSQLCQVSTTCSTLKGAVLPGESVRGNFPWPCLSDRLKHINLLPHDVGASVTVFSLSHQLYGTADLHFQIHNDSHDTKHGVSFQMQNLSYIAILHVTHQTY